MSEGEQQQSQEANTEQQSSTKTDPEGANGEGGVRKLKVSAKETGPSMSGTSTSMTTPAAEEQQIPRQFQHRDSISEVTAGVPSVAYEIPPPKTTPADSAVTAGARGKGLFGTGKGPRRGPPPVIDMGPPGKPSSIIRAEGAPDLDGSSNTFFILELMRQQKEKLMRKKKDEMINEMALKMKRDREEAKRKGATTYSYSYGGFLGVEKLTRGSANVAQPSPKPSRSNPKAILIDEAAAVPSDAKSRAMFEGP